MASGSLLSRRQSGSRIFLSSYCGGLPPAEQCVHLLGIHPATDTVLLQLQLVEDAKVDPTGMELFHHPSATGVVTTSQDSGYFHLHVGDAPVTQASYHDNNRSLVVRPEQPGTSLLTVQDLCLTVRRHLQL